MHRGPVQIFLDPLSHDLVASRSISGQAFLVSLPVAGPAFGVGQRVLLSTVEAMYSLLVLLIHTPVGYFGNCSSTVLRFLTSDNPLRGPQLSLC